MSDDELKTVVSAALQKLLNFGKISSPISSMDLLTRVISSNPLLPNSNSTPRFRLTDLPRFESILESLSRTWETGTITLSREREGLIVTDIRLGNCSSGMFATTEGNSRKRKRIVDEDADSAAGDGDAEESILGDSASRSSSTLGGLSKELREVYTILQKSTAKGRLLAEQVSIHPTFAANYLRIHTILAPI
jgi:mRNA (2'-O-methyladenosine-N6-)-methyltransferase